MPKRALFYCCAYALFAVASYGREGFGFTKRAIEMNRKVPPAVTVSGTRVIVAVDNDHNRVAGRAQTLRQYVEKAVLAGDKNLQAVTSGADVQIVLSLDRLDAEQHLNSKVEDNYVKETDRNGKSRSVNHPTTKTYTTV